MQVARRTTIVFIKPLPICPHHRAHTPNMPGTLTSGHNRWNPRMATPPMTITPNEFRLAELLTARLCHDLAGPLGTLAGAVELVEETGDGTILATAREVSALLVRRLRLLRAAWATDPAPFGVADLKNLMGGLPAGDRIALDFSGLSATPDFTAEIGRVVLNLLLLGAEALRGGGTLHLAGAPDQEIVLRIAGPRAAWPAALPSCLLAQGQSPELLEPRSLQLPLTVLLAFQAGYRLSLLMPLTAAADSPPPLLLQPG